MQTDIYSIALDLDLEIKGLSESEVKNKIVSALTDKWLESSPDSFTQHATREKVYQAISAELQLCLSQEKVEVH